MEVINTWLKFHPLIKSAKRGAKSIPLIVNWDGIKLNSQNHITLKLNKIFKKKISSAQLRRIYLSQSFGLEYLEMQAEMAKTAEAMGHSVRTQSKYIKK